MLVLLFVALWFILRGDLLNVFPCVILFLFSVLLVLRLPRLGKRELILVFFVRLFGLCLFGYVGFLFLFGKAAVCDCGTPWTFLLPFFLQNGQERMIAYFSKTINKAQRQYCVIRRELLAIEEAAKFFRQYLWCLIHCQNRLWWCSVVKKFQESILNSCKTVGSPEHI